MRFDWSKILIAAMALFIIFIVSMGVKMATSSQALYEDDYYEQGEMHAERMEQERAGEKVKFDYQRSEKQFQIGFDTIGFVTSSKFVNLADRTSDKEIFSMDIVPKSEVIIEDWGLKPGIWVIEISGEVNGKTFFKKQQFVK